MTNNFTLQHNLHICLKHTILPNHGETQNFLCIFPFLGVRWFRFWSHTPGEHPNLESGNVVSPSLIATTYMHTHFFLFFFFVISILQRFFSLERMRTKTLEPRTHSRLIIYYDMVIAQAIILAERHASIASPTLTYTCFPTLSKNLVILSL